MISFTYQKTNSLLNEEVHREWLNKVVQIEGYIISDIAYIMTSDEELLALNKEFLNHDYYTDILTFDRSEYKRLCGDIFISLERVEENASTHQVDREEELRRVMVHGLLHMMGYKDASEEDKKEIRKKEDHYLRMFHVEQ